jgi:hypothetical protein
MIQTRAIILQKNGIQKNQLENIKESLSSAM